MILSNFMPHQIVYGICIKSAPEGQTNYTLIRLLDSLSAAESFGAYYKGKHPNERVYIQAKTIYKEVDNETN